MKRLIKTVNYLHIDDHLVLIIKAIYIHEVSVSVPSFLKSKNSFTLNWIHFSFFMNFGIKRDLFLGMIC